MPAPPPYGRSSTLRCLSSLKSRGLTKPKESRPRSCARPMMLSWRACRIMSGNSVTKSMRMVLVDVDVGALAGLAGRRRSDGANGLDHLALLADDLALVLFRHAQTDLERAVLLGLRDLDLVRMIRQALDDELDELLHRLGLADRLDELGHRVGGKGAVLDPVVEAVLLELDLLGRALAARIV